MKLYPYIMSSSARKYAIIDVETTGGSSRRDRLTEIAVSIHDGEKVIERYESLINPEISIPYFIQNLTGITNEMVEDAPYFYEIARKIVEMTKGCIFVAHNVKFDYMFIRSEFDRLGYNYQRKQLCTRQLSKKLFPEIGKYSLDHLIEYFEIQIQGRHRAMADVLATEVVFDHLLRTDVHHNIFTSEINRGIQLSKLPDQLTLEDIHNIPERSGIYYFFGENDHLLYVGKSKNIQKRVMQHFSKPTSKSRKFLERTRRIDFEETGSEITAILREDAVIKRMKPEYNVAQRQTQKPYGLKMRGGTPDRSIDLELSPLAAQDEHEFIKTYKSKRSGKMHLLSLLEKYNLTEILELERSGETWSARFKNGSEAVTDGWAENFQGLENELNARKNFHNLVIDHTYSHQEATCFCFEYGRMVKTGRLDVSEGFPGVHPDELDDYIPPLAINDQIITFIEKHQKRYLIRPLPENFS